jgi:predicted MPP superfamily phosphohydrolase
MKIARLLKIILVLIISGIFVIGYFHLESRWVRTKQIKLVSHDVPNSFVGLKIVFISDIHHGPFLSIERVEKLVKRINNLHPDLILMGGDYVHREPKYIVPVFKALEKLQSKYGVYAVLGNHDHWEDTELTREMMKKNGFKICDNKSYWLKIKSDSIKIGGVGDLWEDSQFIDSTVYGLKKNDFCILLSHNPDYLENITTDLIDLTLSGHTHGAQVTFFGIWAPIVPSRFGQKYRYGLKQFGEMKSYITSGIGTITPPLRFFCRPEVVVIELNK